MADYIPILTKAINGLAENNSENRQLIYQKARAAIDRKLRTLDPVPPEAAIAEQMLQLETAINQVEGEHQLGVAGPTVERSPTAPVDSAPTPEPAPAAATAVEPPPAPPVVEPIPEANPPAGFIDDIILIDGIGEKTQAALAAEGVTGISQIAAMSDNAVSQIAKKVGMANFEANQEWKKQAKAMLSGEMPRSKSDQDRLKKLQEAAFPVPKANPPANFVDDVILIDGVGEKTQAALAAEGITGISQIAAISDIRLGLIADKIGASSFQSTQQWKEQAAEMLSGQLPRSKTDQERLKQMRLAAGFDKPEESEVAEVVEEVPSVSSKPTESAPELTPEPIPEPTPEPTPEPAPVLDTPPAAQPEKVEVPEAVQEVAETLRPTVSETKPVPDSNTAADEEMAIADAIRALAGEETSQASVSPVREPAPAAPPVDDIPVRKPAVDVDLSAPEFVSELEGDPFAPSVDQSRPLGGSPQLEEPFVPAGSVPRPNKRRGTGRAIGCLAILGLLGGLGYWGWQNQEMVQPYLDRGRTAIDGLIGGSSDVPKEEAAQEERAGAPSSADSGEELAKDTTRLAGDEDVAASGEEAPTSIISDPVVQPEQPDRPATVEVEGAEDGTPSSGQGSEQVSGDSSGQSATEDANTSVAINGESAFLYEEAVGANGASRDAGGIVWSLGNEAPEAGAAPEAVIKGVVDIPARGLAMNLTIRRNVDPGLPASHLIELFFTAPPEFSGGNIDNVSRFVMKSTEQARGESLVGVPARIDTGFFLIALNNLSQARQTNLSLLRNSNWIDIPVAYVTGRRGLMTFEKGETGRRVFEQALADWQNR